MTINIPEFFHSKKFVWALKGIAALVILLVVFQLGIFVGFHKAGFSYRWGENYHRAFGGPRGGFMKDFEGHDFVNGHGTTGVVVKIDKDSFVVKGNDSVEKIITLSQTTALERGKTHISLADLKVDDRVVIIGAPDNNGSIEAKVVRVFEATPSMSPTKPQIPTRGVFPMKR